MFYVILAFVALFIIVMLSHEINKSYKTGSWRNARTPKMTRRYIKEKIKLENKYCNDLPNFDSRGIHCGANGSVTDKTGKFDPAYRNEMEELNKRYGFGTDE